jgi:hypothetical protein
MSNFVRESNARRERRREKTSSCVDETTFQVFPFSCSLFWLNFAFNCSTDRRFWGLILQPTDCDRCSFQNDRCDGDDPYRWNNRPSRTPDVRQCAASRASRLRSFRWVRLRNSDRSDRLCRSGKQDQLHIELHWLPPPPIATPLIATPLIATPLIATPPIATTITHNKKPAIGNSVRIHQA